MTLKELRNRPPGTITLEEIEALPDRFLPVWLVAKYLCTTYEQGIRETIRHGVPWGYVVGTSGFMIPNEAFVHYHRYGAVLTGPRREASA